MSARTTIVTVTYNTAAVLPAMLASVPHGTPVVVVDNASVDESAKIAGQNGAHVVALPENAGFGRACNAGAATATSEFLLFLNPDAVLGADCLAQLEKAADDYPDAVAFNPRISNSDGSPYFKRSSKLLPREKWMPRGWPGDDCEVAILSGAAFFCRASVFQAVNGFDEAIFLYHEDDDLALRLQKTSGPLRFVYNAHVHHAGGRASPRSPEIAALKSYHMAQSRVYAMKKHGRPLPFLSSLWTATRKLVSPEILLIARKRAQAIAFLKGVLSTIDNADNPASRRQ